jgi:hypothetical protein
MDIADDVERAMFVREVVPEGPPFNGDSLNFLHGIELKDVSETLSLEPSQGTPKLLMLPPDHVPSEIATVSLSVPLPTHSLRYVEHNRHRKEVVLAGQLDEWPACLGLDIGGIHDGQLGIRQALGSDEVEDLEGILRDGLVVLVISDECTTEIGAQDLGRSEMLTGKGGFP